MTARLVSIPSDSALVGSRFNLRSADSTGNGSAPTRRTVSQPFVERSLDRSATPDVSPDLTQIWGGLIEQLPQGVIVVSRSSQPVYWNFKASELCQNLGGRELSSHYLPEVVREVCQRLIRSNRLSSQWLVMEYGNGIGQSIRIRVRWLCLKAESDRSADLGEGTPPSATASRQPYLLVFLENCADALREELCFEQKKYDLTDREAEIWMLLRQEYTYQEIAKMLQISLNTVKTHVKNVYAKRRSLQGQEKFWYYE
jgi:DNA-directed RNA polymerase specialized sigma24 family protein